MSIDLINWCTNLDSELLREHVRTRNDIYDFLYLYCDGSVERWNNMTEEQRVNLGLAVWRLVVRVTCRPRRGQHSFQLFVLTRFLQKLIPSEDEQQNYCQELVPYNTPPDSSTEDPKYVLRVGEAMELPYDDSIKITYVMRYAFVALGGIEELVRYVGYEALHDYCFEEPVDSCELGDFIDLLASYHPHATFMVIVSVYVQVPVSDAVFHYLNKRQPAELTIPPPPSAHINSTVFEMCLVPAKYFFEDTIMHYNTALYEKCHNARIFDMSELTYNFNALQLLYELSWLIKEHSARLGDIDKIYRQVVARKLWYIRLLLESVTRVDYMMRVVFDCDANLDPFIDVLTNMKAPIFCTDTKFKSIWRSCGNVCMVQVANYLRDQKRVRD